MRLFKDINGNNIDPVDHTLSILKEYPHAKIHIGSDSQNVGKKTNYDIWKRLWLEAEYSIKVAEWLTNQVSIQVEIDMDYNSDESFKSNKLISATKGWANSLGYKVNVKPNNQIATRAADYHCK